MLEAARQEATHLILILRETFKTNAYELDYCVMSRNNSRYVCYNPTKSYVSSTTTSCSNPTQKTSVTNDISDGEAAQILNDALKESPLQPVCLYETVCTRQQQARHLMELASVFERTMHSC